MNNASYRKFNRNIAINFKKSLNKYETSTKLQNLRIIKTFLIWLKEKPGFKKYLSLENILYLNPKIADRNIVTNYRNIKFPNLKQIENLLNIMPFTTDIEKRNKAFISFLILLGCRVEAAISCPISAVDIQKFIIIQNPRYMKTKFHSIIYTAFFPVGQRIIQPFVDWYCYLVNELGFSGCDPLFPKEIIKQNQLLLFKNIGITKKPIFYRTTNKMRIVVQQSFKNIGLHEYSPHSFRHMLTHLGEKLCRSPGEFKAWSQNLGHQSVSTTFTSYGYISPECQVNVIQRIGNNR